MSSFIEPHLLKLKPYVPGKSFYQLQKELNIANIIKLASNENCFGPSPKAIAAARDCLQESNIYPVDKADILQEKICKLFNKYNFNSNQVILGNGSNELINLLIRCFINDQETLLHFWPSFVAYGLAVRSFNKKEIILPLNPDYSYDLDLLTHRAKNTQNAKMLIIANPNNPTGCYINNYQFEKFIKQIPQNIIVVIDEAYAEYVHKSDYPDAMFWVKNRPRTVVLRTFSKIYGLAGLRIGYLIADSQIAEILSKVKDPFNVNHVAQSAAIAALDDQQFLTKSKNSNYQEMLKLNQALVDFGFEVAPSVANFILFTCNKLYIDALDLYDFLLHKGVIVRPTKLLGVDNGIRVTIGQPDENNKFIKLVGEYCHHKRKKNDIYRSC